jgi:hypothetical protein
MVEGSGGNLITCYSFLEQSARDIPIQGVDYKCYRRRPPTTILAIKIFRTAQMSLESSSTQTACSTRYVLGGEGVIRIPLLGRTRPGVKIAVEDLSCG